MADVVVSARGLGKHYRIAESGWTYGRLTESLSDLFKRPSRRSRRSNGEIWALKDFDCEIEAGEVVGIVGRNGAGKTTLLKVLSRITEPSEGRASLRGRVGALLEVGTGFHPELTGRENVYLNGTIIGMRKADIEKRFEEIVEFADVGRFLDVPVKRFSSGMQVRLAFAVAAHLEPEILVIDEVLAVGDVAFQRKCLGKMTGVAREGRTVLFVSHNLGAVQSLCSTAYLLEQGRLVRRGDVGGVIEFYLESVIEAGVQNLADRPDRGGDGRLRFQEVYVDTGGVRGDTLVCGAPGSLVITFRAPREVRDIHIAVAFKTLLGEPVLHVSNEVSGQWFEHLPKEGRVICRFDHVPLLPGAYDINIFSTVSGVISDHVVDAARVHVSPGDFFGTGRLPPDGYGVVLTPYEWSFSEGSG